MIKRLLAVVATSLIAAVAISTPSNAVLAATSASANPPAALASHSDTAQPAAEAPLAVWVREKVYPYHNDDEEFWAALSCRSDAGIYMRQGALGWECRNNTGLSRVELWIQWDVCPNCIAAVTTRS